jgi:hypothetical protein
VENAVQEYSWKKSVEELNDILRNHFGATAGENISLEARLTATVTERDEKQVSTTAFSVTAYKPLTSTLYLIGSATPGGWSADDVTEMTRKDNGIFTWTGRLVAGEFKFITTLGSFLPSYNKGTDGLLVLRSSDDQPDEPFVVEEDHNYIVEANLFTGVLTLTQTETLAPAYDQLYFVGNATDWGFVKMNKMCSTHTCSASASSLKWAKEGNSSSEPPMEVGRTCIRPRMPMLLIPIQKWCL